MDEIPDPTVINELRALFKAGATPSRLMRHIIANREPQILPWTDKLIRAYFREAFRIPMFRLSAGLLADGPEGLVVAHINRNVIHQMIVNRSEWDKESADSPASSTWMDSLTATDESQMVEHSHPESWKELSNVWGQLDDSAKKCIKRLIGNSQTLYEKVEILATLSEQLQQQVIALENEVNSSVGAKTK
jgi:hypothetical protein